MKTLVSVSKICAQSSEIVSDAAHAAVERVDVEVDVGFSGRNRYGAMATVITTISAAGAAVFPRCIHVVKVPWRKGNDVDDA